MDNETTKLKKYDSFGAYCCDSVMITHGGGGYDVIAPNATVRPSLSEFFEKAGYYVFRQLLDVHKIPPEDADILILKFEDGPCYGHFPTDIWKAMEVMMGQTVDMPLKTPFEELLEWPIPALITSLENELLETANKISRNYVKDKVGSLNQCKWVLQDKNIEDFPIPKSPGRSQRNSTGGFGCALPFIFLTCAACFLAAIVISLS